MKLTTRKLVEESLQRVELWQEAIRHVEAAQYLLARVRRDKPTLGGDLRTALVEQELDAWRGVFMWALDLTDEERTRIKAAAHDRFLGAGKNYSHWLTETGELPGHWLEADEEDVRAAVRQWIGGKEAEDEGYAGV